VARGRIVFNRTNSVLYEDKRLAFFKLSNHQLRVTKKRSLPSVNRRRKRANEAAPAVPFRRGRQVAEKMRFLYLIGVGQALLIGVTLGEDTPPNPYQIFAEEQPQIYPTQTNQSSRIQGDRLPDLSGRPSALRPGPIPVLCFSRKRRFGI
jgi:hypothetical protein